MRVSTDTDRLGSLLAVVEFPEADYGPHHSPGEIDLGEVMAEPRAVRGRCRRGRRSDSGIRTLPAGAHDGV